MGLDVGELIATLKLDTKSFTSSIRQAQQQTRNLGTTVSSNLTTATEQASRSTSDLTREVQANEAAQQNLADAVQEATKDIEKEGDAAGNAKNDVKEMGDQSNTTAGLLDKVKTGLGAIGVTVGITQVISKFKEIATQATEAKKKIDDMSSSLNAATGATGDVLEQYSDMATRIAAELGDDYATIGSLVGKIHILYDVDDSQLEEFTKEYQSFFDQLSKAGDSFSDFDAINTVVKKWSISLDENLDYLGLWYEISRQTAVPMSTLNSLLAQGDRAFQLLGMSAEDASNLIGNAYKAGELDDVQDLISSVESLAAAKAEELGSEALASTYIQRLVKESQAIGDEQGIVHMLNTELEINGKTASRLAGYITSNTGKTQTQTAALDDQRKTLTELNKEYETWEQHQLKIELSAGNQTQKLGETVNQGASALDAASQAPGIAANTLLEIADNHDEITQIVMSDEMNEIRKEYNDTTAIGGFNNWLADVSNSIGEWWDSLWSPSQQETTIVLKDETKDGVTASVESRKNSVNSANNPAVR